MLIPPYGFKPSNWVGHCAPQMFHSEHPLPHRAAQVKSFLVDIWDNLWHGGTIDGWQCTYFPQRGCLSGLQ